MGQDNPHLPGMCVAKILILISYCLHFSESCFENVVVRQGNVNILFLIMMVTYLLDKAKTMEASCTVGFNRGRMGRVRSILPKFKALVYIKEAVVCRFSSFFLIAESLPLDDSAKFSFSIISSNRL